MPFGGIVYGSSILVLEVTVRMFWALAQRQKDMDKARGEGREEGREEGRQEAIRELVERGVKLPPEILKDLKEPKQR